MAKHALHTTVPELFALVGPPGAGKSTVAARVRPGAVVISLDAERGVAGCCPADQAATPAAVARATERARAALRAGATVVWDATNTVAEHRRLLLELAAAHGARATALVVLPELATVLARNARRDATPCPGCGWPRRVPDGVVRRAHAAVTLAAPALTAEGWDRVEWDGLSQRRDTSGTYRDAPASMVAVMSVQHGLHVSHAGDDGEMLVLGHPPLERAVAAFTAEEALIGDCPLLDPAALRRCWALLDRPGPDWEVTYIDTPAPGAFPVTITTV
ncbi:AAA family ATPase [Saccharopolyspora cebuensis]|uniref:AAA family ATPase n=1 Tax=Saccharopolyspora cebuensis TaxID=418759 RepID=UPI0031E69EA5